MLSTSTREARQRRRTVLSQATEAVCSNVTLDKVLVVERSEGIGTRSRRGLLHELSERRKQDLFHIRQLHKSILTLPTGIDSESTNDQRLLSRLLDKVLLTGYLTARWRHGAVLGEPARRWRGVKILVHLVGRQGAVAVDVRRGVAVWTLAQVCGHQLTIRQHAQSLHGQRRLPVALVLLARQRVILLIIRALRRAVSVLDSSRAAAFADNDLLAVERLASTKAAAAWYVATR